jgi:hypothetical protein
MLYSLIGGYVAVNPKTTVDTVMLKPYLKTNNDLRPPIFKYFE